MAVISRPARAAVRPDERRTTGVLGRSTAFVAPLLLVAAATALRFHAIDSQSLWYDEGVSAGMVGQGPATIIREAAADFHPPLYYLLLAGWARLFGDSTIALRGLSACAGVLAVVLTWRIATRLFGVPAGWLAAVWAALAPLGIMFSQELRMYMPVAAGVAVAAWCTVLWLDNGDPRRGANVPPFRQAAALAGYVLAAAVSLYLQYVAALGLAAVGLYGLGRARGRRLGQWLVANLIALLLFAPWLPTFHHQLAVGRTATTAHTAAGQVLSAATGSLLVGVDGLPALNRLAVAFLAALVVLGIRRSLKSGARGTLPLLVVLVPLAGVTAYANWRSVYEVRYVLVALPGVAMLGGLGVWSCGEAAAAAGRLIRPAASGRLPAVAAAAIALLLVVAATGAADVRYYVAPLHPHDDYRGLAQTIARNGRPGDAVLLYPPGQNHVVDYYYRGPDAVDALPMQRPPDAADVTQRLAALFREHPRVWVVEYGAAEADPTGIVSTWLAQHAFLASHQWFGSPQLLLYIAADGDAQEIPAGIELSNGIELQSYAVAPSTVAPGRTVEISLRWLDRHPVAQRFTVFTHVLDAQNHVVAQHDGEPAGGTRPTTAWKSGDVVQDRHGIVLPAHLAPGAYAIEVGMYLPNGGTRARVLDVAGRPVADRILLGQITVTGGQR